MAKHPKKRRLKARLDKKKKSVQKTVSSSHKASDVEHLQQTSQERGFYKVHYKKLLIIPFAMLIIALVLLGIQFAQTGAFFEKGISLQGGSLVTLTPDMFDVSQFDKTVVEQSLQEQFPNEEFIIRTQTQLGDVSAIEIETTIINETDLHSLQQSVANLFDDLTFEEAGENVQVSGSTLGEHFFKQIIKALIIAFVFMGIVVFIQFKVPIPSLAVILAAFSDIVVTLAIVNLLGIKLSTAGVAAFLMLIGYSVDTDILLSTRVLKRKDKSVYQRTIGALKTGLTMNITTLAAVSVALIVSNSATITQIMTILFIGLWVDMINTWLQNAGILRWYMERKAKKGGAQK
ncbi:MAG: protein translocase subunit SecF [Candidatus Nanoarchaeia archaeon]